MLTVLNKNEFDLRDRFDGRDYVFPSGKKVAITEEAARHIFGLGESDKVNSMIRLGWMTASHHKEEAINKMNNFIFEVASDLSAGDVIEEKLSPEDSEERQGSAPLLMENPLSEVEPDGEIEDKVVVPEKQGRGRGKRVVEE